MDTVHILPIFLLAGNHVCEDIPLAIQAAQETLQSHQSTAVSPFVLRPHLGRHPQLKAIIQANMTRYDPDAWILIGHGSRRPEGNISIQQLASQLQAIPAFWAVQPSFSDQVKTLVSQGIRSIGVIPYFLFPGKITDAIAAQAEELSRQYPDLTLRILSPLNPTPQLATALLDLSQSPILGAALQAKAM
jgi:sirohydrochlorin ferrochelatase